MNDAEFAFRETIKERKSAANGARYRKVGSKSTKCSLPHDRLTKKELKNMNGEIFTISENKQLSWQEFKALPDSLQGDYIRIQVEKHGASQRSIAKSMGINQGTLCTYLKKRDISTVKFKSNDVETKKKQIISEENTPIETQPPKPIHNPITAIEGSLTFTGNPAAILDKIFRFLDAEKQYKIVFTFEEK